jgi:adenosylcobinamide amidohydrolase
VLSNLGQFMPESGVDVGTINLWLVVDDSLADD